MDIISKRTRVVALILVTIFFAFVVFGVLKKRTTSVKPFNDTEVIDEQPSSYNSDDSENDTDRTFNDAEVMDKQPYSCDSDDLENDTDYPIHHLLRDNVQPESTSSRPLIDSKILRLVSVIAISYSAFLVFDNFNSKRIDNPSNRIQHRLPKDFKPKRICYDNMLVNNTSSMIRLYIGDEIAYGKKGIHALTFIDKYIRRLAYETNHRKLFLYLDFEHGDKKLLPTLDVSMTLLNALRFYRSKRKKTTIIAYSPSFGIKSYLIASYADKILTNRNENLYLPWSFMHQKMDEINGTKTIDDRLDERNLSDPIIQHKENQTIAGKYKVKAPDEDILAIQIKTLLDVFSNNVKTRKIPLFSFGTLLGLFNNIQIVLVGAKNVLDLYYTVSSTDALTLRLIDKEVTSLETSKPSLVRLKYQLKEPLYQKATIDVVYIIGKLSDLEQAKRLNRLFNWLTSNSFNKGVLLVIDSLGGRVDYIKILEASLSSLSKKKHVSSYTQNYCLSAAYEIASYSKMIIAQETARIGSIGVKVTFQALFPFLQYTQEKRNRETSKFYDEFIDTVTRNRCEKVKKNFKEYKKALIATQARYFPAIRAKEKGLIDYIGDIHMAIDLLQREIGQSCSIFHHEINTSIS